MIRINSSDTKPLMSAYLENSEKQQEQLNMLGLGKGRTLKGVEIKEKKPDDKYETFSIMGPGHADQVVHAAQVEIIGGLTSTRLMILLKLIRWVPDGPFRYIAYEPGSPRPMLVLIDNIPGKVDDVSATDIETVEVLHGASGMLYDTMMGVILITTKKGGGGQAKDISSTGILPISVMGYYKAREFYSPKYQSPPEASNRRDLRSTIFWKPELLTDKDGKASFDFYNADGAGTYRLVIEGMDEKGDIGGTVYRYKVE